jgi:hypothetical protein
MKVTDSSKTKIKEIEALLAEVKERLKTIDREKRSQPKRVITEVELFSKEEQKKRPEEKVSPGEILPSEEELQAEYETLYEEFVGRNFKSIREVMNRKSKTYLKAFCRANKLPIDAGKVSKGRMVEEVMRWIAQRKAVTKKST